ncbi:MAG: hypothetical protein AAGU04_05570 [Anaerolineaceae bacterium]
MNMFFAPIEKLTQYLDPGTGSMVIQVIFAALLSVGVLVRVFWRKIRSWFTPKNSAVNADLDPTEIVGGESDPQVPEDSLK